MKLLGMNRIAKRLVAVLLGIAAILMTVFGAVHNYNKQVDAATKDGATVSVVPGTMVYYGDWETHKYTIGSGSSSYVGFCVNPTKSTSRGQYPAVLVNDNTEKFQKIKLAIYVYTVRNNATTPIINDWFQSISDENMRYAYVHAIVGYINDGATRGLSSQQIQWLNAVSQRLHEQIAGQTDAWKQASGYQLYGLNLTDQSKQNIMWIEKKPEAPRGSITVTKKDAETHKTTPQGNASFDGITFIAKQGQTEKGRCTLSGGNSSCKINNLEYGTYTVSEAQGSNTSYQVNVNSTKSVTLNSSSASTEFENTVKKGTVKVTKKDSKMQGGECKTTSGHSFNGITFGLYIASNNSHSIIYGGQEYAPSQEKLLAKKSIGSTGCVVEFTNLPYGNYYVKEIVANADYILDSSVKSVSIPNGSNATIAIEFSNEPTSLGTTATDKADGDHYIEAGKDVTIKDTVKYCVEPNKQYVIKGVLMDKSTGKELLVNGKTVEGSTTIKPTSSCGTAVIDFKFNSKALKGKTIVVFEKLYAYKADGKYDDVDPILSHEDINDVEQTIYVVSLGTTATDKADGDHYIGAQKNVTIKDTVKYCVEPNKQYVIKGVLMDKNTGKKLTIGGKTVEGSTTIKPTSSCGTAVINFTFNAAALKGQTIVVFEKLYEYKADGNYDKVDPIVSHEDIDDVEQTIYVVSLGTTATDKADGDHYIEAGKDVTIKDTVKYCVEPNKQYVIKGVLMDKSTGKELLVNGKTVEGSTTIKPTSSCGTAVIDFTFNSEALSGKSIVVFEKLYEYKADGNYDKVDPIVSHEDIDDTDQTIDVISLGTLATDLTDGDKAIVAGTGAAIRDVVSYCVKPGQKYIIRGVLMNKATGEPLLVNGAKVESAMEIEPTENCGTAEMLFHFDATGLEGVEVVVFERLYTFTSSDEEDPIIKHEDINDEAQTVMIYLLTPDTGHFTASNSGVQGIKSIIVPVSAIFSIGGYVVYRSFARKRFLGRK